MEFSEQEKIFLKRMRLKMNEGMTFDQAAQAVIDDDKAIDMKLLTMDREAKDELAQGLAAMIHERIRQSMVVVGMDGKPLISD